MHIAIWNTHNAGVEATRRDNSDAMKAYLHSHASVTLLQGGATLDDNADAVVGGLMIVDAASIEDARAFVADSPFSKAGVIAQSQVQPLNWMTGRPG